MEEVVIAPVDEWVEEIVEKEVVKEIVEDRKIPQVRAMYNFSGQDIEVEKGEVCIFYSVYFRISFAVYELYFL